jgi:HPt (histidine-containing phosphotransfer) domain-containing protein
MIIDQEAIQLLYKFATGDDPKVFDELVVDYIGDSSQLLEDLSTAVRQKNPKVIQRVAHTLKGQSATFGAMDFSAICRSLELLAESGKLDGAQALVNDIKNSHVEVIAALKTQVEQNYASHQSE